MNGQNLENAIPYVSVRSHFKKYEVIIDVAPGIRIPMLIPPENFDRREHIEEKLKGNGNGNEYFSQGEKDILVNAPWDFQPLLYSPDLFENQDSLDHLFGDLPSEHSADEGLPRHEEIIAYVLDSYMRDEIGPKQTVDIIVEEFVEKSKILSMGNLHDLVEIWCNPKTIEDLGKVDQLHETVAKFYAPKELLYIVGPEITLKNKEFDGKMRTKNFAFHYATRYGNGRVDKNELVPFSLVNFKTKDRVNMAHQKIQYKLLGKGEDCYQGNLNDHDVHFFSQIQDEQSIYLALSIGVTEETCGEVISFMQSKFAVCKPSEGSNPKYLIPRFEENFIPGQILTRNLV